MLFRMNVSAEAIDDLAHTRALGALLDALGDYALLAHWKQGEFHHDVVVRPARADRSAPVLVIATNCNGGVKEVIAFDEVPERAALWHWRCPDAAAFAGQIPPILARATTEHFFDPCELLRDDARSELLPVHRRRQEGGGWEAVETLPSSGGGCGVKRG